MTETGRAAVFRGPGKGFELRELPLPALEPGAILIRVSLANLKGHDPMRLVAEHVSLIEAMQRRDARSAARIIKAHVSQTETRVLPALKRNAVIG